MFDSKRIDPKVTETIMEEAISETHMISLIYQHVFGITLDDLTSTIDPKHYRISRDLALDLLEWAGKSFDTPKSEINMLWLQLGPASREHLDYYEIEYYAPKGVYQY